MYRITWNPNVRLSARDSAAIERALLTRSSPGTAFVDDTGSFLITSLDEAPDPGQWTPCAMSSAGPSSDPAPSPDADLVADLRAALKDRNEAIDRVMAQRDAAIADLKVAQDTIAAYLESATPHSSASDGE